MTSNAGLSLKESCSKVPDCSIREDRAAAISGSFSSVSCFISVCGIIGSLVLVEVARATEGFIFLRKHVGRMQIFVRRNQVADILQDLLYLFQPG
ncbi:hypothetical protein NCT2013_42600 [Enterobacter sp. M4-VN]|nr:hypothetical protein NCT2013_42600 [Enterobacter sp. M4-VN]